MSEGYEQGFATNPPFTEVVGNGLNAPGDPLDAGIREFMEAGFGFDFGGVRVHTDSRAADSSKAINAKAYTIGQDVVFGAGKYSPGSGEGKKLIAHELSHVVQQFGNVSIGGQLEISKPWDESERAADDIADLVVDSSGGPTNRSTNINLTGNSASQAATVPTVSRQTDDDNQRATSAPESSSNGGGLLGFMKDMADPALEFAGDVIPGAGIVTGPISAALSGTEGMQGESTFEKVKGALGFATGTAGTAAEMGGFSLLGGGGEAAAGSMALGALPEAAAAGELGTLGLAGPVAAVLGAGLAGVGTGMAIEKYTGLGSKAGDAASWVDNKVSGLFADPSKPAYTQTLGWKLANMFD